MKTKILDIGKICLEDDRFRISYYFSLDEIVLSLRKAGLIQPPVVSFLDNHFVLVSGWKRVIGCREISLSPLPVFLLEEKDELKIFLLTFYENLSIRRYKIIEKAEILKKLKKFGEEERYIVKNYMPLLEIPRTLRHLDSYIKISCLEPEIKRLINEKDMPFYSIQMLVELDAEERLLLLPFLSPLGQNKQKELLEGLLEVSKKEGITIKKILNSSDITKILNSKNLSYCQKGDKIRLMLNRRKYPAFFSWKDSFESCKKRISWPEEITLKPSRFFEDDEIFVRFGFKDRRQFLKRLSKLRELADKGEFSKMIGLPYDRKK